MTNYKQKIIEALQEKKSEQYTPLQQIMLGAEIFGEVTRARQCERNKTRQIW